MPETTLTIPTRWAYQRALALETSLATPLPLEEWQRIRRDRIDRLAAFLAYAVRMARLSPNPSWWSRHAIWAIQHLEQLDYRFPECDPLPIERRAA
jgi:hypothetical protein